MIKEQAIVVSVNNDKITVVSKLKSACSGCQQVEQCGSGQVASAFPKQKLSLTLTSSLPVNVGDHLVLGLSESALLSSAWQVYLWPIIGLILSAFLGQYFLVNKLNLHEILSIVLSIFGGYLGYCLAKSHQDKNHQQLAPKIISHQVCDTIEIKNIN